MNVKSPPGDGYGWEKVSCGCSYVTVDPKHRRQGRMNIHDAIRYVIRVQHLFGFDPTRPRNKPMRSIYNRIQSRLRLAGCKEKLEFFVGIGTCLDCLGVDVFFRCGKRFVTADLYAGLRKRKGGKVRADIVLSRSDFITNKHYQIGDRIAQMLLCPPTEV